MARASSAKWRDFAVFTAPLRLDGNQPIARGGEVSIPLPKTKNRGGARNRADRESNGLTSKQVAELRDASLHAFKVGLPLNRFITIDWELAGIPLQEMVGASGDFWDLLKKWLARRGFGTARVYVHENAPDSVGGHCHMLVHVPPECVRRLVGAQKRWLRNITGRPYRKGVIKSVAIGRRLGLETANPSLYRSNLDETVAYMCKGALRPPSPRWSQPGGLVMGKRCGTSQNIGKKARGTV